MSKELQTNWYKELLIDLKKLEFTGIVLTKWNIGKRILVDFEKFGKPEYGSKRIESIASDLDTSKSDIYSCVSFAEKYPKIPTALENSSWRYVANELLPEPRKEKTKTPELPKGKYEIVYADPPWEYGNSQFLQEEKGIKGKVTSAADLHYPVMSVDEIKAIPVDSISAENCLLFMWTSSPHLEFAIQIINSWGFEYKTIAFVWDKKKINPSAYTLSQVEICLVAKKGNIPEPRGARNVRQFLSEERRSHSQKPEEVRKRIEKMFPTQKKVELFSREKTKGWSVWGNEI